MDRLSHERGLRRFIFGLLESNALMTDTSAHWRIVNFINFTITTGKAEAKFIRDQDRWAQPYQ